MDIEVKQVKAPKKSKPKTCPKRHSNFFITINTNKNINSMDANEAEQLKQKFNEVMDQFFNLKLRDFIVLKGSKIGESYGFPLAAPREELEKRIISAKAEYVVEIGPESRKLHAHGMLCLEKRGVDSKLDYELITKWLEEQLGFHCYFKNEMFRDAKKNLQDYLAKAPAI